MNILPAARGVSAPQLRIRVDLRAARPGSAGFQPAQPGTASVSAVSSGQLAHKERRKLKAFTFEGVSISYGQYKSGRVSYWQLFYYERRNGKKVRRRESRVDFASLKARAEEVATNIANGQQAMTQFREDDRACYLRCLELARAVNTPLEILVAEAVEARKKLETSFKPLTAAELADQMLAIKRREKSCGAKWLNNLEKMLERLSGFWTGPYHLIPSADLNTWLRNLPGGLVYRKHHRAAALQLLHFARANNALPADYDIEKFSRLVDDPQPPAVKIKVWTPDQLVKLLAKTHPNMVPFTALQAFAGLRNEELVPEEAGERSTPLDWRDFDWEQNLISVSEDTGKTGARIVPMSDNLIAWLKPYVKESGPVCTVANVNNALTRAKRRAGLPAGKGESRNILRKSFGSYRLAVVKHIGQVADEMGNSPEKIRSNYRKPRPEREGKRWFNIWPTHADILQLNLAGV